MDRESDNSSQLTLNVVVCSPKIMSANKETYSVNVWVFGKLSNRLDFIC